MVTDSDHGVTLHSVHCHSGDAIQAEVNTAWGNFRGRAVAADGSTRTFNTLLFQSSTSVSSLMS